VDFDSKQPRHDPDGRPLFSLSIVALGAEGADILTVKVAGLPKVWGTKIPIAWSRCDGIGRPAQLASVCRGRFIVADRLPRCGEHDSEGNTTGATMAPGYVACHPASNPPTDSVVRIVGSASQYLFANNQLEPIVDPTISDCLLTKYGQTSHYVVPTMWSSTGGNRIACNLRRSGCGASRGTNGRDVSGLRGRNWRRS
jgi:hypothetical protein